MERVPGVTQLYFIFNDVQRLSSNHSRVLHPGRNIMKEHISQYRVHLRSEYVVLLSLTVDSYVHRHFLVGTCLDQGLVVRPPRFTTLRCITSSLILTHTCNSAQLSSYFAHVASQSTPATWRSVQKLAVVSAVSVYLSGPAESFPLNPLL